MMRPATLLWVAVILVIGLGLFKVKYEVQTLEAELTGLHREIRANQQAIHILNAEWAYLNQPERLAELSERFLKMRPVTTQQLATVAELPFRGSDDAPGREEPGAPRPVLASAEAPR